MGSAIIMQNRDTLQNAIKRIKKMEQFLDEIKVINEEKPEKLITDVEIQGKIQVLETYLDSGQWMKDYERDERGELPVDLKRGVLSEDTLYNLLTEVKWGHNYHENSSETSEYKTEN